ncbi:MAG: MFS transporter [Pseudomonadota bacterium]
MRDDDSTLVHATFKWWVLGGLWFLYASFGLIVTSIAPLVLPIEHALGMSHAAMGSVMGAWQLVYIFSAIPCGVLLDRIGGHKALVLGALLIGISALGRGIASDYWGFLFAVMVFGLGGPIISSGAPKVVAQLFQGSQRGLAMGIYMTGPALGGVVCLTMTHSVLLPAFDMQWRMVMFLWGGVAILAGLIWWLIGWPANLKSDTTGEVPKPQLEVMGSLIAEPAVRILLLMSVGVFLYNHGLNNWLPQLLENNGFSEVEAGLWAALPTVVGIVGSLLIPRLATGQRRFTILLWLWVAAMFASMLLHFEDERILAAGLILQGIARSSLMTVLILTLVELPGVGEHRAGVASGMFFSAAEIGGVLGPLGLGVVYDLSGGFTWSLYTLTGVSLAMLLATRYLQHLALRSRRQAF